MSPRFRGPQNAEADSGLPSLLGQVLEFPSETVGFLVRLAKLYQTKRDRERWQSLRRERLSRRPAAAKPTWNRKANIQAERALTLGKSLITQKNTGFYYPTVEESEDNTED